MKPLILLLISSLLFMSCEDDYKYATQDVVPDSNKIKVSEFIIKTVSAASLHMSTADYEDPEDVIEQAERTANRLYSIQVEGLHIYQGNSSWVFIPYDKLSENQIIIFNRIKNAN